MRQKESVHALRQKIDQIDEKIVGLLNKRASIALQIGRTKNLANEEIYVPGREKAILNRLATVNHGPLSAEAIRSIYREVLSASRSLETPLKVAYLGPEATFTHMAAQEMLGTSPSFFPFGTITEVFQEVRQGRVDYGIVPIENSTEGVVTHTLDLLVETEAKICAEVSLEIHLHLLSKTGRRGDIQCIVSHPQALAQCRRWIATHFPHVRVNEVASTAQAAQLAAQDPTAGAIASRVAKDFYALETVEANIEDHPNNMTRFFLIGDQVPGKSGDDKTSIVFSVKDEVGILHRMLEPFAKNRINLTKIESRPLKHKRWEYLFFLDFLGHVAEPRVQRALKMLEKNCVFVKVLGSYPRGV